MNIEKMIIINIRYFKHWSIDCIIELTFQRYYFLNAAKTKYRDDKLKFDQWHNTI